MSPKKGGKKFKVQEPKQTKKLVKGQTGQGSSLETNVLCWLNMTKISIPTNSGIHNLIGSYKRVSEIDYQ